MTCLAPTGSRPQIQSQSSSTLGIKALAAPLGNQFHWPEMVMSFDFSLTAIQLQRLGDSHLHTLDGLQEAAVAVTLYYTVTPTTFWQLVLSIDNLVLHEEAAAHSEVLDIDQGQSESNDARS